MSSLSDNFVIKNGSYPYLQAINACMTMSMHANVTLSCMNVYIFIFTIYITLKELTEKPQVKTFQLCICEANTNSLGVSYIALTNDFVKTEQAKEKFSIL